MKLRLCFWVRVVSFVLVCCRSRSVRFAPGATKRRAQRISPDQRLNDIRVAGCNGIEYVMRVEVSLWQSTTSVCDGMQKFEDPGLREAVCALARIYDFDITGPDARETITIEYRRSHSKGSTIPSECGTLDACSSYAPCSGILQTSNRLLLQRFFLS